MKALQIPRHKTNLTNILIDLYKNVKLTSRLGFKGGTAAMLFYSLPRFSTDLDFDLLQGSVSDESDMQEIIEAVTDILNKKYVIKDHSEKFNTLFWLVSYGEGLSNIKVEISTRKTPFNHYEPKILYGSSINVLSIGDMIAHKLVSIQDRPVVANRDIFDVHYFLGTPFASQINHRIIKQRTDKYSFAFYNDLYEFLKDYNPRSILEGLGEVLDPSQKDWARVKLIPELLGLLERQKSLFFEHLNFVDMSQDQTASVSPIYHFHYTGVANQEPYDISFPIKLDKTVNKRLQPKPAEIEAIFNDKLQDFLLTQPAQSKYKMRTIRARDAATLEDLKSVDLFELA